MYKVFLVLSIAAIFGTTTTIYDSSVDDPAKWRSKSGSKEIKAEFIRIEKNKVFLKREDGKEVGVVLDQLLPADSDKAQRLAAENDDQKQLKAIGSNIDDFVVHPDISPDIFVDAHRSNERAPYAGLAASFLIARNINDAEKAGRILDEVIERLTEVRKYAPDRHSTTLVTALNNRGIIFVKEKAFSKASIAFTRALAVPTKNGREHVLHNAQLLIDLSAEKNSVVEITAIAKKQLLSALQQVNDAASGNVLPEGRLFYIFNFDRSLGEAKYQEAVTQFSEMEDNCMFCDGDGVLDCADCLNGVVSYRERQVVGRDPNSGKNLTFDFTKKKECDTCRAFWGQLNKRGSIPCPNSDCNKGKIRTR